MPLFFGTGNNTWVGTSGGTASAIPSTWTLAQPTYTTTACTAASSGLWSNIYNQTSAQTTAGTSYFTQEDIWMDATRYYQLAQGRTVYYRERTQQERYQQEQAREVARRQQEEWTRRTREALERSRELLLANLTKVQRETFVRNNWFVVVGGKTKQSYRIRTNGGAAGNIDVLNGNKVSHRLCCHCSNDIPLHDHHLAQKLALECDEDRFLKLANRQAA
jgi:hypothetical protein